jgi:hypothetical protein
MRNFHFGSFGIHHSDLDVTKKMITPKIVSQEIRLPAAKYRQAWEYFIEGVRLRKKLRAPGFSVKSSTARDWKKQGGGPNCSPSLAARRGRQSGSPLAMR